MAGGVYYVLSTVVRYDTSLYQKILMIDDGFEGILNRKITEENLTIM